MEPQSAGEDLSVFAGSRSGLVGKRHCPGRARGCKRSFAPKHRSHWCCSVRCRVRWARVKKRTSHLRWCQWSECDRSEGKSDAWVVERPLGRMGQRFCSNPCRIAWHNEMRRKAGAMHRDRENQKWGPEDIAKVLKVEASRVRQWLGLS